MNGSPSKVTGQLVESVNWSTRITSSVCNPPIRTITCVMLVRPVPPPQLAARMAGRVRVDRIRLLDSTHISMRWVRRGGGARAVEPAQPGHQIITVVLD